MAKLQEGAWGIRAGHLVHTKISPHLLFSVFQVAFLYPEEMQTTSVETKKVTKPMEKLSAAEGRASFVTTPGLSSFPTRRLDGRLQWTCSLPLLQFSVKHTLVQTPSTNLGWHLNATTCTGVKTAIQHEGSRAYCYVPLLFELPLGDDTQQHAKDWFPQLNKPRAIWHFSITSTFKEWWCQVKTTSSKNTTFVEQEWQGSRNRLSMLLGYTTPFLW